MPRALRAESLAQYVEIVCRIRDEWIGGRNYFDPWFRGVSNETYALEPSLYRHELAEDEEEIRAEFIRRGTQLLTEREPQSEWEWYFLMQHYGAPTRLLDWTTSAVVGVFFALCSYPPGKPEVTSDAAVWMLDPWWLNSQVIGRRSVVLTDWKEDAGPYLPALYGRRKLRKQWPIAIDPPHVARRVAVQHSRFTVHGTREDGLTALARRPRSRLRKIVLPRDAIVRMRVDLYTCGVTDGSIFPDLEGLSRELARFYTDLW